MSSKTYDEDVYIYEQMLGPISWTLATWILHHKFFSQNTRLRSIHFSTTLQATYIIHVIFLQVFQTANLRLNKNHFKIY